MWYFVVSLIGTDYIIIIIIIIGTDYIIGTGYYGMNWNWMFSFGIFLDLEIWVQTKIVGLVFWGSNRNIIFWNIQKIFVPSMLYPWE